MLDTIVNSFDIWTDAQGLKSKGRVKSIENISLEGITNLRQLVLDLAIQGLLVPQDPTEESANKLLTKNIEEKKKLIKKGVSKKHKPLLKICSDDIMESLPNGWEVESLQEISWLITKGSTPTSYGYQYTESGIRFVKVENIEKSRITTNGKSQFIDLATHNFLERSKLKESDILFSIAGTIGRTCVVTKEDLPANTNQALAIIRGTSIVFNPEFLLIQLDSFVSSKIKERARGGAMNNISLGDLNELILYIPPLNEQLRIVAKVNELMALCDKLEEEQFKNIIANQVLVKTLLETLTQAADVNELHASWERLSKHFDTLFCTEDSIDQLKQTILQLAVMGKLVKQDPNDEPANELLKKIAKAKEILIEKGKLKKQAPLSEISDDEKPFDLPNCWEWTRLGEIGIGSTGKTPSTSVSKYFGGNIPFIGPGQITSEGKITEADKTLTEEGVEYSTVAEDGDILMVCIGGTIGKCAIVKSKTAFNQQINCMHPLLFHTKFLFDTMNATYFQQSILNKATGSATPIINRSKWEEILIPAPSLSEQLRIVQKVDELFALCDSLVDKVRKSQDIKVLLSKTIVEKTVQ